MESKIYDTAGKEVGSIDLPKDFFEKEENDTLLREVLLCSDENKRNRNANTKTRAEVSGGGRKPWKQKGLGRARHSSIRSPIWVAGGITFGPRSKSGKFYKLNKKVKRNALSIGLSQKARENKIILINDLDIKDSPKTKKIEEVMKVMEGKGFEKMLSSRRSSLFVIPENDQNVVLSARNIKNADIKDASSLNACDVIAYRYIFLIKPKDVIDKLKDRLTN